MTDALPEQPKKCETRTERLHCKQPHKQTYDGWDGERYECELCGHSYFLDYEDMK